MTKTQKNLTLGYIERRNDSEYREHRRLNLNDEVKLDIARRFKPSVRDDVVADYLAAIQDAAQRGLPLSERGLLAVAAALIIKHFTSLRTNATGYAELATLLAKLQDSGYLEPILAAFDPEELEQMNRQIQRANELLTEELEKAVAYRRDEGGTRTAQTAGAEDDATDVQNAKRKVRR
ncbi:hypothetical protein IDH44_14655 [Paenibacillus sp. IB182496]|uniref:Uncharacterized protein n=1 Tax=Paenibacillus sabuli TaxID=2772509 RepID=A0A927BVU1_9BACL|nr:hypothetical protein [Paenibacillus sabuli]MBD2846439.1 hypothetical protein [Paenibacillus sabuli]